MERGLKVSKGSQSRLLGLQFDQEKWMAPYVKLNTDLRAKTICIYIVPNGKKISLS